MERDSGGATAALQGCRSGVGADRAPADACRRPQRACGNQPSGCSHPGESGTPGSICRGGCGACRPVHRRLPRRPCASGRRRHGGQNTTGRPRSRRGGLPRQHGRRYGRGPVQGRLHVLEGPPPVGAARPGALSTAPGRLTASAIRTPQDPEPGVHVARVDEVAALVVGDAPDLGRVRERARAARAGPGC